MNPPTNCLECGTPLQASDAGGLCPKCLLRLGLASQLASGTLPASAVGLTPNGSVIEPFDFRANGAYLYFPHDTGQTGVTPTNNYTYPDLDRMW